MSETSEMTRPKPGTISWNQLVANKTNAAFYSKIFGWEPASFVPPGMPDDTQPMTIFKTDPDMVGGVAGLVQKPKPEQPSQWIPFIVVEDLDAALTKAAALGATIRVPAKPIGEFGRIAVIHDPEGAAVGLHEFPK